MKRPFSGPFQADFGSQNSLRRLAAFRGDPEDICPPAPTGLPWSADISFFLYSSLPGLSGQPILFSLKLDRPHEAGDDRMD
jgi:hypothetical protein